MNVIPPALLKIYRETGKGLELQDHGRFSLERFSAPPKNDVRRAWLERRRARSPQVYEYMSEQVSKDGQRKLVPISKPRWNAAPKKGGVVL